METHYVYILTNDRNTVLYTGSTSNLKKRINHHKRKLIGGFTKKYNVHKLVYFEVLPTKPEALKREQTLKKSKRLRKMKLISAHPEMEHFRIRARILRKRDAVKTAFFEGPQ